jgi:hypothetical protein
MFDRLFEARTKISERGKGACEHCRRRALSSDCRAEQLADTGREGHRQRAIPSFAPSTAALNQPNVADEVVLRVQAETIHDFLLITQVARASGARQCPLAPSAGAGGRRAGRPGGGLETADDGRGGRRAGGGSRQGVGRACIARYALTAMSYQRPMIHFAPTTVCQTATNSTVRTMMAASRAIESRTPSSSR